MTVPTCLYRQRDAQGRTLYIGVSSNPSARFLEHVKARSPWLLAVVRIDVEWFPTREIALLAEAAAIAAEQPVGNVAGTGRRYGSRRCEGAERLASWLNETQASPETLAHEVGSTGFAIVNIASGRRRPGARLMQRMEAATHGAVPASSWWAA